MAWRRPGDKPLSEPMVVRWLTHICVTRLQWVNKQLRRVYNVHMHTVIQQDVMRINGTDCRLWLATDRRNNGVHTIEIDRTYIQLIMWINNHTHIKIMRCNYSSLAFREGRFGMMTSSNGNIFRFTGPLCGELTGHRWIPYTKAGDAELWCFLWSAPE